MSQPVAALVAKPVAAAPQRTSKLAGAQKQPARDPQEQEADRAASKAAAGGGASATPPSSASSPGGDTPPAHAMEVLRDAGRPLDTAVRKEMAARLNHDFSRVRIHTGTEAAASANRLQAQAYTIGSHVVFNTGRYDPQSREGRQLLAHELTHVVQQSARPTSGATIQFKKEGEKKPEPGKFYQEVIDNVEYEKKEYARRQKESGIGFHNVNSDSLKLLLALCEAVDQNQWDVVPTRLDQLLEKGLMVPFQTISESLLNELSARIYEMGLESDALRLRKAYSEDKKNFSIASIDDSISRRNIQFYARLIDGAVETSGSDKPEKVDQSIHKFVRAFIPLRDAYLAIDWEALKWERQSGSGWMVLRPGMSHEEWYRAVTDQMARWLGALSGYVQQTMAAARADFENNGGTSTGAALLEHLLKGFETDLKDIIYPGDGTKDISGVTFAITKTTLRKGEGSIEDFFATGKEAKERSVPITTYDPAQEYTQELRTTLDGFYRIRREQLHVLGRIYGDTKLLRTTQDPDKDRALKTEAGENAASIGKLSGGRLRLDSDDDWRNFLLQKYKDMTSPQAPPAGSQQPKPHTYSPAEALHTIVDLLFAYLRAFTVHARFTNIYDSGEPNYLNRPFPRALTGQLVHDCGVYALRVAYMLSLVRKELNLKFRFVVLPVHVSLVITGDKMPAYVVENDSFEEIPADNFKRARGNWDAEAADPKPNADSKADEDQFVGELAASDFITGPVDMPFKVVEVPQPVQDARKEQSKLWTFYKDTSNQKLFGPSSDKKDDANYLFHKRYLALTEELRQVYNETLMPFWNQKAPAAWNTFQKAMSDNNKRTRIKVDDLMGPLANYKGDYADALKPVKERYERFFAEERELSKRLRDDPKLAKTGVRLSYGPRAATIWTKYWIAHEKRIANFEQDMVNAATGAEEELQDVTQRLDPFFEPVPYASLPPLN